jgi:hypothetical protein
MTGRTTGQCLPYSLTARGWVGLKQQVPPLRYAPVGMTLFLGNDKFFSKQKCHPDRIVPGFPAKLHWTGPRVRLSVRERRMKCTSATEFHRKSGGAEWRDLLFSFLLGGRAPDNLDEIVQPELAGEGCFHLIGVELKVLLCRHDWLIQGQTDYCPAQ